MKVSAASLNFPSSNSSTPQEYVPFSTPERALSETPETDSPGSFPASASRARSREVLSQASSGSAPDRSETSVSSAGPTCPASFDSGNSSKSAVRWSPPVPA